MEFLFLGTGSSAGTPVIGCSCKVCLSGEERLRPSGLIEVFGKKLLIDIGPDFKTQALRHRLDIDGVLLTHTHYDHIAGIDEMRAFNIRNNRNMPCLLSKESFETLQKRYEYLFDASRSTAKLDFQVLQGLSGHVEFCGVKVRYFHYWQTDMQVTGYRVQDFAYVSDIKRYEEKIFDELKGVETLVLSALKKERSTFHFGFEDAVAFARKVGAKATWLTHVGHSEPHEELNRYLPDDIKIAYDGLKLCMK